MTLVSSTLLANTPQLILSLLYFYFNSIFTSELVDQEWNEYGHRRKPLRVTNPRGKQKSTYWLDLPSRYGLPLMAVAILLHWLFSRAIFPINIGFTDTQGNPLDGDDIVQCGWSPSAVIMSIVVSNLVLIVGLLFGLRRYRDGPPLLRSCGALIAASCPREPDEDADMLLLPLQWGVTSSDRDGIGHCTFSARRWKSRRRGDCIVECDICAVGRGSSMSSIPSSFSMRR